jgi:hypothetical protein
MARKKSKSYKKGEKAYERGRWLPDEPPLKDSGFWQGYSDAKLLSEADIVITEEELQEGIKRIRDEEEKNPAYNQNDYNRGFDAFRRGWKFDGKALAINVSTAFMDGYNAAQAEREARINMTGQTMAQKELDKAQNRLLRLSMSKILPQTKEYRDALNNTCKWHEEVNRERGIEKYVLDFIPNTCVDQLSYPELIDILHGVSSEIYERTGKGLIWAK